MVTPTYPESVIWYVEARPKGWQRQPQMGTAVAVRLRPQGQGKPRSFLLTCTHVIRATDTQGNVGYGALWGEILCWKPGSGYASPDHMIMRQDRPVPTAWRAVVAGIVPIPEGDVPMEERSPARDWALLDVTDSAFQDMPVAREWGDVVGDELLDIFGYPGGAERWKGQDEQNVVTCLKSEDFREQRLTHPGTLRLSGAASTARGMSGGGIFNKRGELVGLHRSQTEAHLQFGAVRASMIRDALREHGWNVVSLGLDDVAPAIHERWPAGRAFADRQPIRDFLYAKLPAANSRATVVGLVDAEGQEHVGKSFFWFSLQHAASLLGITPILVDLEKDEPSSASELFELIVDQTGLPRPERPWVDATAKPARQAKSLVNKLVGLVQTWESSQKKPLWVVIDHLDKIWPARDDVTELVIQLVRATSDRRLGRLRLILMGLPEEATGGLIDAGCERVPVDPLNIGDIEQFLRLELRGLPIAPDLVEREAAAVFAATPRAKLHMHLAAARDRLCREHGGCP